MLHNMCASDRKVGIVSTLVSKFFNQLTFGNFKLLSNNYPPLPQEAQQINPSCDRIEGASEVEIQVNSKYS